MMTRVVSQGQRCHNGGADVDQLSSFAAVPVLPTRASLETDPNIVMEKVSCYKLLCLRSLQLTNKTQAQVWVFF
jgi:hypothetical protein